MISYYYMDLVNFIINIYFIVYWIIFLLIIIFFILKNKLFIFLYLLLMCILSLSFFNIIIESILLHYCNFILLGSKLLYLTFCEKFLNQKNNNNFI